MTPEEAKNVRIGDKLVRTAHPEDRLSRGIEIGDVFDVIQSGADSLIRSTRTGRTDSSGWKWWCMYYDVYETAPVDPMEAVSRWVARVRSE